MLDGLQFTGKACDHFHEGLWAVPDPEFWKIELKLGMKQIQEIGAPGVAANEIFLRHREVAIFFCLGCHVDLLKSRETGLVARAFTCLLLLSSCSLAATSSRILG